MYESDQVLYKAIFASQQQLERAVYFLKENTRPDFSDDVSEQEQTIFEAVDEIPYPDVIKDLSNCTLYWAMDDGDDFPDLALAERLGAEQAFSMHLQMADELCITICRKEKDKASEVIFEPVFFDDLERDRPIAEFTDQLQKQLHKGGEQAFEWLEDYLKSGKSIPNTL